MHKSAAIATVVAMILPAITAPAAAQSPARAIEPEVARRDVQLPRLPNKDFHVGAFFGTYATENFGSAPVAGVRLGYHITEDVFVEAALAKSRVSDESFRQVLPGGVFPNAKETLSYANLSAGWNLLPGEVFFGRGVAKASTVYLIGGIGTTHFFEQRRQTINLGFGMRLLWRDWAAVQLDVRDHLFSLDLLGKRQSTQNVEVTFGASFFF